MTLVQRGYHHCSPLSKRCCVLVVTTLDNVFQDVHGLVKFEARQCWESEFTPMEQTGGEICHSIPQSALEVKQMKHVAYGV